MFLVYGFNSVIMIYNTIAQDYHIYIFENMGVISTKPQSFYDISPTSLLSKSLEITPVYK